MEIIYDTANAASFPELDGIVYLTGVSTDITRNAGRYDLGLLATPASSVHRQRGAYELWAADNGCFAETAAKPFDADRWLAWLEATGPANCIFAALPDVVGDAAATWDRSEPYIEAVKALGFPVAIVLQDGLEDLPEVWAAILERADAVFLGGSTEWKLGPHAARFAAEARAAAAYGARNRRGYVHPDDGIARFMLDGILAGPQLPALVTFDRTSFRILDADEAPIRAAQTQTQTQ